MGRTTQEKIVVPGTLSSHANHEEEDMDIFETVRLDKEKETALKERSRLLAAKKAEAMLAIKNAQRAATSATSEDEFEIIGVSERPSKPGVSFVPDILVVKAESKSEPTRRGPDARAILQRNLGSEAPTMTKNRQKILRYAGKSSRAVQDDVTETHVDFAAKAWKHGEMKNANGGAVPAGQKKGRDVVITRAQLDHAMRMKHKEQTEKLRKKKEEEWGRARLLPEKTEQDIDALVAATAQQSTENEDSDEEDEDFVPEGDEDILVEEGDEVLHHSGEETEGDDEVEEDDHDSNELADEVEPISTEEGAKPDSIDDDEEVQVIRRKARPVYRVAFGSDDEEATPRATQKRTAAVVASSPTRIRSEPDFGGSIDLGGFGDDAEGGFSQLFEATQVDDQPAQIVSLIRLLTKSANVRMPLLDCEGMHHWVSCRPTPCYQVSISPTRRQPEIML